MSLSLEVEKLGEEVMYARQWRQERMRIQRKLKAGYHTPFLRGTGSDLQYDPENHAYRYVTRMVSQMFFKSPRARVESRRGGAGYGVAIAHKHYLNRWAQRPDVYESFYNQAHDILFSYCATLVRLKEDYRFTLENGGPALNPIMERVSPDHLLIDQYGSEKFLSRFIGHEWITDKDDLIETARRDPDAGWLIKEIQGLPESYGVETFRTKRRGPDRKEIVCADLWIRDLIVDEDAVGDPMFNGSIVTLAIGGEDSVKIIKEPMPCPCPSWGPYSIGDINYVQDEPLGLSPLVAHEGQARELNDVARSVSKMIQAYAMLVMIDDNDPAFAQKVKNAQNTAVLAVRGLDKNKVVTAEKGGVTEQVLLHLQVLRDRLQRDSGFDDAQLGMAKKGITATANVIADSANDILVDLAKTRYEEHVRRTMSSISNRLFHTKAARWNIDAEPFLVDMGFPYEMAAQSGIETIPWRGGDDEYEGLSWEDLDIAIEPKSMNRTVENAGRQKMAVEMYGLVLQSLPVMAAFPTVDWAGFLNALGDEFNCPDLARLAGVTKGQTAPIQMQPQPQAPPAGGGPAPTQEANGRGLPGRAAAVRA